MGIRDRQKQFEAIYETYYDRVYKYAYMLLLNREDAEDITEETFVAAYTFFDRYDENRASPGTYLTRIAHNKAVNLMRSAEFARRTELPESFEIQSDEALEEHIGQTDEVLRLYAALTPEEREFLNLRYVMELRDREIAALLDLNEKAVNKRYQRLLEKCRKFFSP